MREEGGHYMINNIMMKERTAIRTIREAGNHNYHCGFRKTRLSRRLLCCYISCGELEEFSTSGVFDI